MECQTAIELLPWLINGTIEDDERRALSEHIRDCTACRRELEATVGAFDLFEAHPPSEVLVDYAHELEIPERELVEQHIEGCEACREDLDTVRANIGLEALVPRPRKPGPSATGWRRAALAAAAAAVIAVGSLIVQVLMPGDDAQWAELQQRVDSLSAAETELRRERQSLTRRAAEAESLVDSLRDRVSSLELPLPNVQVLELFPLELALRGESQEENVDSTIPFVTVILATDVRDPYDAFRLDVWGPGEALLWRAEGLELQPTGDFTVQIPTGPLPAGTLTLRLEGRRGERWQQLETYVVRVAPG